MAAPAPIVTAAPGSGRARSRRLVALLTLLLLTLAAPAAEGQVGTPAADLNRAALLIRHGDGRVTYAYVLFVEEEISGIDLLRRSGVEIVTIPFGGLGEGVCEIEGEGCPASECRRRVCQASGVDSPYWRYFGLEASGVWTPFALGASATRVTDGAIHGWSWTSAEAGLPVLTLAEVAIRAGAPTDPASAAGAYTRTEVPPGFSPRAAEDEGQPAATYLAAGLVVLLVAGGALYGLQRGRRAR